MSLPARPLRAVDDVIMISDTEIVATKKVVADDPYLVGHFPGQPVYPGVFVLESVCQALDVPLSHSAGEERTAALSAVRSLRLLAPLVPGDLLTARISCTVKPTGVLSASASCTRGDGVRVAHAMVEVTPSNTTPEVSALELEAGMNHGSLGAQVRPAETTRPATTTGLAALTHLLPQRHPMVLVDRIGEMAIVESGPGSTLWTLKAISATEPCYADLGPDGDDAYPASLLLESFLQSAAVLWAHATPSTGEGTLVLGGTRRVAFASPVRPGDVVRHWVRLDMVRSDTAFLSGWAEVVDVPGRPVLAAESVIIARRPLAVANGVAAQVPVGAGWSS